MNCEQCGSAESKLIGCYSAWLCDACGKKRNDADCEAALQDEQGVDGTTVAITPTLANLHRYSLNLRGRLMKRRSVGQGGFFKLTRDIERDFETVFRRPMELADITPDVATMLLLKAKRDGMRRPALASRQRWFINRNETAKLLGWMDKADFSEVRVDRQSHWTENRQNVPKPQIADIGEKRGRPSFKKMTLTELLDKHYIPARLVGKSDRTILLYRCTIRSFTKWLGREPIVADLNLETTSGYLRWLIENTKLSPHTIEKERAELTSFWNFCAKRGWLPNFPDIPTISCPKRVPDSWADEEMVALMDACHKATGMIGKVNACDFWPALVSVLYDCGERISATMTARHEDIDRAGWLTIKGEHRKGKTRDRRYKLRPITLERIAKIRVPGQSAIFEWPLFKTYLFKKFGEILVAAGLPNNRRSKTHKIRRTVASNFEAAGGNATSLLDHTDRRTTEAYLDPRVIKQVQPADIVAGIGEQSIKQEPTSQDTDRLVSEFRDFLKSKASGGAA